MQAAEALHFVKDELERNYACSQGGGVEARRQNIQAMPTLVPRLSEYALLGTAVNFPDFTKRILGNDIEDTPYRYLGGGSENTTITDGSAVVKVYRKSTRWTEEDRQTKAAQFGEEHHLLRHHLGDFAVLQHVTVDRHPLRPDERVILTTQARYDFEDTGIFRPYGPGINTAKIQELEERYPGMKESLGQFAVSGLRLFGETGLLIDSSGLNNVVIAEREGQPRLTCLDGTPAFANKKSVAERIIGQLVALRDGALA